MISLTQALQRVLDGRALTRAEAESAMSLAVEPDARPEQLGALLVALRMKGESVDEFLGFLDCLRARAVLVECARPGLMDVCGTGGDSSGIFNVSTTVAFVAAAAGQPVAKHGNRSVSSRSGSFDVLEALGMSFESDPKAAARSLDEHGIALLFAPAFHPALKAVGPLRKSLGVHTVFNALGPLLNPAPIRRQLVGVYSEKLLEKYAHVLKARGFEEAMIVRGEDGLDEISLSGPTRVLHLKGGALSDYTVRPEDAGLKSAPREALKGGDARENASILISILDGEIGPRRDVVLLNAAAALLAGGRAADLREGTERAAAAIDSGKARALIRRMGCAS